MPTRKRRITGALWALGHRPQPNIGHISLIRGLQRWQRIRCLNHHGRFVGAKDLQRVVIPNEDIVVQRFIDEFHRLQRLEPLHRDAIVKDDFGGTAAARFEIPTTSIDPVGEMPATRILVGQFYKARHARFRCDLLGIGTEIIPRFGGCFGIEACCLDELDIKHQAKLIASIRQTIDAAT